MKRIHQFLVAGFAALCLTLAAGAATAADIHTKPPANFKKVSTLVKLPDYLRDSACFTWIRRRFRSDRFSVTTRRENW